MPSPFHTPINNEEVRDLSIYLVNFFIIIFV